MQTTIISPCSDSFCSISHCPSFSSCRLTITDLSQSEKQHQLLNHVVKFRPKHGVSKIMCASDKDQANGPINPAKSTSSGWKKWMAGIVLSVALPSVGHKYGPLLMLKSKIDAAVKTAESVTEAVEELAEEAEKFIERIEEKLPEDSKLKESLDSMEALAQEAEKEAKKAEKLIHQVEVIEKEVETALLKSATSQITKAKK